MIKNSTKVMRAKKLIATVFLISSFSLGVSNVFAQTAEDISVEDSSIEVKELELEEKTESAGLSWNKKMGYIEISINLKEVNFNVYMDEVELSSDSYSLSENKNTLFIHSEYLSSLKTGEHKLQINNLDHNKLLQELTITIEAEDKTSTSTSTEMNVDQEETKPSISATESKSSSSENDKSTGGKTDNSNKSEGTTRDNNTVPTSKKVVTPIRPEINASNENKGNNLNVENESNNRLNNNLSNKNPSGKNKANTISSTGVTLVSLPASALMFTASAALVSTKRKYSKTNNRTENSRTKADHS